MNCLMIDSAEGARVLLLAGDKSYYAENLKNAGAETLMPVIDSLLKSAGKNISDVDVFGVCIGPGSFTGLRVGLATVKTLCYALDKRCFAVNNLRLNSYNNNSAKVISIAHAGNNVCYIARFDGDETVEQTKCVTVDEARRIVVEHPDHSVSTDIKLAALFAGTAGVGERELKLAVEKHSGTLVEQKDLVPLYVRKPQPERGEGDL